MERQEKVLIEVDYITVTKLRKKKRLALKKNCSLADSKKQLLVVIDRSQLSSNSVEEVVKKHFHKSSLKTVIMVLDYRAVESEENKCNPNTNE